MGLGGFGGAGPEGPPNVTEGAGQAPPPTGCLRPYSFSMRTAKKARRQVGLLRTLPIYLARTHTTGTALEHTLQPCPGR